ncbi:MAG TPA: DUF3667 domain-containing protein [Casimicrobiaceae bacterium]|nr:DUF3667 domain-containing protein [Casimicrobiaceae bacterium]
MQPVACVETPAAKPAVGTRPPASERCRNCGALISGNFCANCGQETAVALPPAGRFLREAAGRYVALDGRLWRTVGALLFRPGFLTSEYLAGRRRRYVRPSRLFVALSILMFAILGFTIDTPIVIGDSANASRASARRGDAPGDESVGKHLDRGLQIRVDPADAAWLAPVLARVDEFNVLSRDQKAERIRAGILRYAPYAAIGLLPVFALMLKIAYADSRRRHPRRPHEYAAHLVFGAHNHAFVFLAVSAAALVDVPWLRGILVVWMIAYGFLSMKAVYGGRWSGIVLRAAFVAVGYLTFFGIAIAGLLLAAIVLR